MTRLEVAVIGGGIAGTSVGYFLAERASVTVIEAEATLGVHSTGRSAAVFTECYGEPVVRRLALASRSFLERPPDGFTDEPLLADRGIAYIATESQEDRLEPALESQRELVPSVRAVDTSELVAMCPVIDPAVIVGGVFEPGAKDLDVHGLHLAYQRGLRARGGRVMTGDPLVGAERRGDQWHIRCRESTAEVDVIVDAAGAWCDDVARRADVAPVGLVPKRRTAFTFSTDDDPAGWPMIIDLDERFYFKPEGPGLLASPADAEPMEPHDVRHREEDVARGIERIHGVTSLEIRSVQSAWAGLRSFVADSQPVNGWDDAVPGFYWLAGQGGFGIKTSPAMGAYAAAMILDGAPGEDLRSHGLTPDVLGIERLRT